VKSSSSQNSKGVDVQSPGRKSSSTIIARRTSLRVSSGADLDDNYEFTSPVNSSGAAKFGLSAS
jgi:hypothetical protein